MKNSRCLRKLINDPQLCILRPDGHGFETVSTLRDVPLCAARIDSDAPTAGQYVSTEAGLRSAADLGSYGVRTRYRLATFDVRHGSVMQLYDRMCAMQRIGIAGIVLQCGAKGQASAVGYRAYRIARFVETLASVRWDPDFVIGARIEAPPDMAEVSSLAFHLNEIAAAGADLLFAHQPISMRGVRELVEEVGKPLCVDFSGAARTAVDIRASRLWELQQTGIAAVVLPFKPWSSAARLRIGTGSYRPPSRSRIMSRNRGSRVVTQGCPRIRFFLKGSH